MRSRFLALLLVLAMWPGAGSLVESVLRLASHGELAGCEGACSDCMDCGPSGSGERGCAGLCHICACHPASPTTVPTATIETGSFMNVRVVGPPHAAALDSHGATAPPIRPPIA